MSFVSAQFPLFFLVVCLALALLPRKAHWVWLVVASCWFYMAFIPAYILILFVLIGVDYTAGLWIENSRGRRRKAILVGSLIANVGMLAAFKYLNFLLGNFDDLLQVSGAGSLAWRFPWVLPIGLSFHTFQSMAYTIEVYHGRQRAERHLGIYSLYVLFFPQMVAGPIERPQNLLGRLHQPATFTWEEMAAGLRLMAWGLFKKVVVADRLAVAVDEVFRDPSARSGSEILLASYFFAFQIYGDFSGYTDIARGAARFMGFRLMRNFDHPYVSRSPAEFWHRWHISLSSWFRDYLYFPLGGSRGGVWKTSRNLLLVFAVSGLWHGAAWTFLAWGVLHGAYVVGQRLLQEWVVWRRTAAWTGRFAVGRWCQAIVTFHLVAGAWIFFRASSLGDAGEALGRILSIGSWGSLLGALRLPDAPWGIAAIAGLLCLEGIHRRWNALDLLERVAWPVRWLLWYALLAIVLVFGRFGNEQFLYFQF